ncbi:MAG: hypothetical protein ACI9T8_000614 [Candidatus Saccharimonadales bacterium]|jgi:hypothetical protein
MFKLDNAFLEELGLGVLPPVEKNKMLAHIYETLEMRVGVKLAEQMSNEQLDEFEGYINRKDEAGALKWLESNFPNYKQVVAEELEKLKGEISQVAPQIAAQAQAAAQANQQPLGQAHTPQVNPQQQPTQQFQPPQQQTQFAQTQPQPQHQQPDYLNPVSPRPVQQPQQQNPPDPPVHPYQPPTMTIPAPTTNYDRKQPL